MNRSWLRNRPTRLLVALALLTSVFFLLPAAGAVAAPELVINEVDADQVSTDSAEFVELYDGGVGATDLSGMVLVFFNGSDDASYAAFDLDGMATDANGYFVLCANAATVANCDMDVDPDTNLIQNGADAVALLTGDATDFPNDTPVTTTGLLDAIVYDTDDADDAGLLVLLNASQPQVNERDGGDGTAHSNQRCPNGSGGQRNTDTFEQWNPTPGTANVCFDPAACGSAFTAIYDIQGSGSSSPIVGSTVWTEGVVISDFGPDGFHLQDPIGDGNPATSDGIFIEPPTANVTIGDHVRVKGTVEESFGLTQLASITDLEHCGTGSVAPTPLSFPLTDREPFEGMLVSLPDAMAVTDTFNLHRFGEAWLTAGGVSEQPTNAFGGGTAAATALAAANMGNSILLDDGSTASNPDPIPFLRPPGTLRLGDTATGITAAMHFGFGEYRLWPVGPVTFTAKNLRPATVPEVGGDVKVASANVLNYWTTLGGRGASTPAQLAVQTDKLVDLLRGLGADIIALQEVENDPAHTPMTTLVAAMNAAEGATVWAWIGELDYYNTYPIRNEIIYRTDRVTAVGDPETVQDLVFDEIPAGRSDPVGRPPVAQTFMAAGEKFTVMTNHFKSKGCSGSSGLDTDQGDGQSCFNARRVLQAERVLEFADDLRATTGDDDVLVVGDLNAYMEEDPILAMEDELTNLITTYDTDPYSFNFFAMFAAPWIGRGALDHAFATSSMAAYVTGAAFWHTNADEPRFLDWFDTTVTAPGAFRSSDHDPIVIGLNLTDTVGLVDPDQARWYLTDNGSGTARFAAIPASFFFGDPGDFPITGDWNCDGIDTPGMYRQSDGKVYLRNSNSQGVADISFFFGNQGDIPIAGDFNGDGCDTVSVYRPSEGRVYIINELGANNGGLGPADFAYFFGNPGDKPYVGDFDGDGIDTIGLHRESTGLVYYRNSHTAGIADASFLFGNPGDRLVAGDWGVVDGIDSPGVFRPANTTIYLRYTNTAGVADESHVRGQSDWLPVAGRFGK